MECLSAISLQDVADDGAGGSAAPDNDETGSV